MKKLNIKKAVILFLTIFGISNLVSAQSVNYRILDDNPFTHKLEIGIIPIDFRSISGNMMGGPAATVVLRPVNRIAIDGLVGIAPILKPDGLTGLKNSGGLLVEAGGTYVWNRKGKILVEEKGDTVAIPTEITLKGETTGVNETTRYTINVPTNRMIERGLRAGGFFYELPTVEGASSSVGAYAGISKYGVRNIKVDADGYGERQSYNRIGYRFDLLFGSTDFFLDAGGTEARGGVGFRFAYDYDYKGGLIPIGISAEVGTLPGGAGFWRAKFSGIIMKGRHEYKGDYKYSKRPKKFIPILIQGLI